MEGKDETDRQDSGDCCWHDDGIVLPDRLCALSVVCCVVAYFALIISV